MKRTNYGRIGEDKASEFLEKLGYLVLERNYREKFGEIDIIAKSKDRTLIFVEVKTMLINELTVLKPEDNFTTRKFNKVKRICEFFVRKHPELIDDEGGWRIDVIAVELLQNGKTIIRHYENV